MFKGFTAIYLIYAFLFSLLSASGIAYRLTDLFAGHFMRGHHLGGVMLQIVIFILVFVMLGAAHLRVPGSQSLFLIATLLLVALLGIFHFVS